KRYEKQLAALDGQMAAESKALKDLLEQAKAKDGKVDPKELIEKIDALWKKRQQILTDLLKARAKGQGFNQLPKEIVEELVNAHNRQAMMLELEFAEVGFDAPLGGPRAFVPLGGNVVVFADGDGAAREVLEEYYKANKGKLRVDPETGVIWATVDGKTTF